MKQLQIILSILLSFLLFSTAHAGTCTTSQRADLATAGYKKAEIEKMCSGISSSTPSNLQQHQAELPQNSVFSVGQAVCKNIQMTKKWAGNNYDEDVRVTGFVEKSSNDKVQIRISGMVSNGSYITTKGTNVDRINGDVVLENGSVIWDKTANWGSCDRTERSSSSLTSPTQQTEAPKVNYVSQGGLTWMPVTFPKNWANANAYCTNTAINGQTGWRLPTKDELSALYASGAMKGQGWALNNTWSSTPDDSGGHYGVGLHINGVFTAHDTANLYVPCVRSSSSLASPTQQTEALKVNSVSQGGLTWMPVTFKKEWADANAYCMNTAINGQTGWRLPTPDELIALYASGAMKGQRWTTPGDLWSLGGAWSSSPGGGGYYEVNLDNGTFSVLGGKSFVMCVRPSTSLTSYTQQTEAPGNYVSQGGLTWWTPLTIPKTWTEANAYCTNTTINGQTGWRLPTKDELLALGASGVIKGQKEWYSAVIPWSSTPGGKGGHYIVSLRDGSNRSEFDTSDRVVTCVR